MRLFLRIVMTPLALLAVVLMALGVMAVPVRVSNQPVGRTMTARRKGAAGAVNLNKRRRWFAQSIPENWVALHEPGLRAIFHEQVDAIVAMSPVPRLFNVQPSTRAFEETFSIGGVGDLEEFNGTIQYDLMRALWKVQYRHKKYAKGWQIDEDTIADDLYNEITRQPREYGLAAARTREKHAADVFNNAFDDTNHPGYDGESLCDVAHPLTPDSTQTQSNRGSSALSYDAVIATRRLMRQFTDSRGELVTVVPDTLVVPIHLEEAALTIIGSDGKPGTANNDANTQRGRWSVVVWDYLNDTDNWFMVDSARARMHNWWWDRETPSMLLDPQSAFNMVVRGRVKGRWSTGWDDWRWVYGHLVS